MADRRRYAADVDDRAVLATEMGQRTSGSQETAPQVDAQEVINLADRDILEGSGLKADADVVDQYVQAREVIRDFIDHVINLIRIANITFDKRRTARLARVQFSLKPGACARIVGAESN
jgi:hypothetical protein